MKKIIILFISFLFLACSDSHEELNFVPYKVGDSIELVSIAGAKITLKRTQNGFKLDSSDKIIMFDIFGTYCTPCQKEAPYLMDYQNKNNDDFLMIGLIYFENISNKDIIDNFVKKYNAYYFISNSKENNRLVEQILNDIKYNRALEIPFKVVLKDGIYQDLSDNLGERNGQRAKFYLGELKTNLLSEDIKRIKNN